MAERHPEKLRAARTDRDPPAVRTSPTFLVSSEVTSFRSPTFALPVKIGLRVQPPQAAGAVIPPSAAITDPVMAPLFESHIIAMISATSDASSKRPIG
jgi:hypothetical protein